MELAKKNRALNVGIEREKSRVARLQSELEASKKSPRKAGGKGSSASEQSDGGGISKQLLSREISAWKEKYSDVSKKLVDVQTKHDSIKVERDRLARVLSKEVGEDVSVSKILEEGSDWRGRAQQIILLKEKIRDLRKELGRTTSVPESPSARLQEKNRKTLQKLEGTKRREKELLAKELDTMGGEFRALKKRHEATCSRKQTIEAENKDLKQNMGMLLAKTQNDDRLIEAFKKELQFLRDKAEASDAGIAMSPAPNKRVVTIRGNQGISAGANKKLQEQVQRQEKIILALTNKLNEAAAAVEFFHDMQENMESMGNDNME